MKSRKIVLLSVFSALLLSEAWPVIGFSFLIFFAFVPLFFVEESIAESNAKSSAIKFFGYSYLTFFVWNILTTWWIYNASLGGAIMAILANALLMALVFTAFHKVKKKTKTGFFSLICFWIAFEYLHLNWDLSWPWLTLGNVFSMNYKWVQWYEFTGILGGSLWVLIINIAAFYFVKSIISASALKQKIRKASILFSLIIVPIFISYIIYSLQTPVHKTGGIHIVIVQPNIDPYNEKFNGLSDEAQLQKLLKLADEKVDSTTDYLIAPETAIASNIWENQLQSAQQILLLKQYLKKHPRLKIVIGASTTKAYVNGEKPSATARKFTQEDGYYDSYNTALQIDTGNLIQMYHKSKLVPGVEKIPFPLLFKPFESFAINLGGTAGSLGVQDERTVFRSVDKRSIIAPVICYESIYGEFVSDYVSKGAQLIFIITNDGWWGDTPGYKQHLSYASLRAIETRRNIARSANTGTSAIINSRGDISLQTEWWKEAVIKTEIFPSNKITFYVEYGDYLGKLAAVLTALILVFYFYLKIKKKDTV